MMPTCYPEMPATRTETTAQVLTYREALFTAMTEALQDHPHTILMGQGVDDHKGIFGTTLGLHKRFGADRVFDVPLAEEGMTGVGLGAALNGLYPIQTHIRADFALLAMNQIVNLAAKYRYMFGGRFAVPMLIRMVVGRSWGQGAQHSQSLQSLFAHVPGLTVIMPAHPATILDSYRHAVAAYPNPVISLEHRLMYDLRFHLDQYPSAKGPTPFTSRRVRPGRDVTIVATSIMVLEALRAADYLQQEAGMDCEVIDLHCISHPDRHLVLSSVAKTGRLLVADTSWQAYGVAAEVCRWICESRPGLLRSPAVTVGMAPAPCPTAKSLEDLYYPSLQSLTDALARLITGRRNHGVRLPDETSMADVYKQFKGPF
jgi:acetoin:2,6-dichlorophenolindophenol oxidoreductase subunit beta